MDHVDGCHERQRQRKRSVLGRRESDDLFTFGNADDRWPDLHGESGWRHVLVLVVADLAIGGRGWCERVNECHGANGVQLDDHEQCAVVADRHEWEQRQWRRLGERDRRRQSERQHALGHADDRWTDIHRESSGRDVFVLAVADIAVCGRR